MAIFFSYKIFVSNVSIVVCINDRVTEYRRLLFASHVLKRTRRGKITSLAFAAVSSFDVVSTVSIVVIYS